MSEHKFKIGERLFPARSVGLNVPDGAYVVIKRLPKEGRRENLSQANKLSRTFAKLLEALNRHRGKGQQKVTVEHVHVHSGGQAVVGIVEPPGGGHRGKSEDQPHAKQIAHAPQPAMWGSVARDQ